MIVFPNCKINIGLNIIDKRSDGFHNIETIFYPIPLKDALEITPSNNGIQYAGYGLPIKGDANNNLCLKACTLLQKDFPQVNHFQLSLLKTIPMGAGLGGGSADGAFTLQLLNQYFALNLSKEALLSYALQLGSDCPFFIENTACFATGRGEELTPIALQLKGYYIMIVNPHIHVNTAMAFSLIKPRGISAELQKHILLPIEQWQDNIVNDFEIPIMKKYSLIASIKEKMLAHGALYSAMTGTGSTVYGIFKKAPIIHFENSYFSNIYRL